MGITAMSLEQEHPCSGETGQAGEKGKEWFSLEGTGTEDRGQPVVSALELGLLPCPEMGKRKAELTREPA